MSDVRLHEPKVAVQAAPSDAPSRQRQHRRRAIDANERDTSPGQGKRDAAGAATELEDGPAGVQGEIPPERHIAPAQRLRILPVIERGVVVPAFEAFHTEFKIQNAKCKL